MSTDYREAYLDEVWHRYHISHHTNSTTLQPIDVIVDSGEDVWMHVGFIHTLFPNALVIDVELEEDPGSIVPTLETHSHFVSHTLEPSVGSEAAKVSTCV